MAPAIISAREIISGAIVCKIQASMAPAFLRNDQSLADLTGFLYFPGRERGEEKARDGAAKIAFF